ncbi:hypothetical protein IIB79_02985 [candidate division KSB1 bacterium]|nr:hypothetical protein [candidate division KSB1 bacterium]
MINLKRNLSYLLTAVFILFLSYVLFSRLTEDIPAYTFWKVDIPSTEDFTKITMLENGTIIAISESGTILLSKDNGDSWSTIRQADGKALNGLFFDENNNGWSVGANGTVLKTTNGGETWKPSFFENSDYVFNSVWFLDELNGYLAGKDTGNSGILLITRDGGESWTEIQISVGAISDIVFDAENTGFGVTPEGIITKIDADDNWRFKKERTELQFDRYFPVVPFKGLMSGTENGLYFSFDKGNTWSLIQDTSPYKINDVFFIDASNGWAVGEDGVFLYTTDGGESWLRLETGITSNFNSVSFVDRTFGFICGERGIIIKVVLEP